MKPRGLALYIYISAYLSSLRTNQRKRWKREKWRWKRTSYSMAFKNTFEMLSEDAHQPPSSSAFTSSPTPHLVTISGSNATSAHFS